MIHIVFNEYEVGLMGKVMEMDETLQGEVILIRDDFAVGPIAGLDTEEGWQARSTWWRSQSEGSPYTQLHGSFDDRETVKSLIQKLEGDPEHEVWIWMGQNQHDVIGYYWLMPQLTGFQGRILVVYLNNLPFINEKGQLFYPSWLHEIQPREFLKARKLARQITASEFEIDPDEWRKLAEENSPIRILEGGKKIVGRDETFYDQEILKNLSQEWQKASRALVNVLNRMKIKTGDIFLMKRIKVLIEMGKIEVMGDPANSWKDFDVKLPGGKKEEQQSSIEEQMN